MSSNNSNPKKYISTRSAKEIYEELIKRIKDKVNSEISVVYDPETGIQKAFLKGKLLWVKKVRIDK
jgi:hypothetical protein